MRVRLGGGAGMLECDVVSGGGLNPSASRWPGLRARVLRPSAGGVVILCMLALLVSGCGQKPASGHSPESMETQAPGREPPDPMTVEVADSLQRLLKVADVSEELLAERLRVPGKVDFDERQVTRIGSNVTGRITDVLAARGQRVAAGEVLARLHSAELGESELAWLKARARANHSTRAVERATQLFQADVIGRAELLNRETEAQVAQAELLAAENRLRVLGMTEAEMQAVARSGVATALTTVRTPIAGTVVERSITQGQVVQPSDALYTVANLSSVWVQAEVPEQQSDGLRVGQPVTIEIPALGGLRIDATLTHVDALVDRETRTVLVRTRLDNRDGRLKPEMLATMLLAGPQLKQLAVPDSAVVLDGGQTFVFVRRGSHSYRLTGVRLGELNNGLRSVQEGLRPGDKVVVDGTFHLNGERKRAELGG